ncbi:MAG: DUF7768 domain-containing protein [Planctomycetota bacterium]|jgi:nucleoside 2-deoxyribosyltransferase
MSEKKIGSPDPDARRRRSKRRTRVYVAGPFRGEELRNIHGAARVATWLLEKGYAPFCPHTHSGLWQAIAPQQDSVWLELAEEWLLASDCVLRIPRPSVGGDAECALAEAEGIPVYRNRFVLAEHEPIWRDR